MKEIKGKKVLIVEDDNSSFLLIREILRPLSIDIHRAIDGQAAIDFILINPDTSVILMDIKLPEIDGYSAAKTIRNSNPNIPIIAQTAFAMKGDKEKALASGCCEYLTKPIDQKKLVVLVSKYLSV